MNEETISANVLTEPLIVLKPKDDNLIQTWTPKTTSPLLLQPSLSEPAPKSPGRRKISESRGVTLPDIKLHQQVSNLGNYGDEIVESPPPTASPVGHYLKPFSRSPKSLEKYKAGVLEICIFLPDQRGIQFKVDGGRMASVEQLSSLLWTHLNLKQAVASEMFSLWMCSPLLEVQLKPHHIPLEVRKFWPDLLKKFTTALREQIDLDEPLLMVKRNVLLSKSRQLELVDQVGVKGLELLFLEAREAILTGRYLCPLEMCIQLAAINMTMEWGPCSVHHTNDIIHQHLDELIPAAHLSSAKSLSLFGWTMPGCKGMENEYLRAYQEMSLKALSDLRKMYIDLCMQLPTYGSALFTGQIERHGPMPMKDLPVKIMISREFVCVVDPLKYTSLLTVPIEECSWQKHNSNAPQCLSSFFIHFVNPIPESTDSKLLQIFTKQAVMMDALMTSSLQAWDAVDNDNTFEEQLSTLDEKTLSLLKNPLYQTKCNRLCLATFDQNGICKDAVGSLKMVVDVGQ